MNNWDHSPDLHKDHSVRVKEASGFGENITTSSSGYGELRRHGYNSKGVVTGWETINGHVLKERVKR